jgi:hypothetical protein
MPVAVDPPITSNTPRTGENTEENIRGLGASPIQQWQCHINDPTLNDGRYFSDYLCLVTHSMSLDEYQTAMHHLALHCHVGHQTKI